MIEAYIANHSQCLGFMANLAIIIAASDNISGVNQLYQLFILFVYSLKNSLGIPVVHKWTNIDWE